MKQIKINSILIKISNMVFETTDFKTAQQTAIDYLRESNIDESSKSKMIEDISKVKNIQRLQTYCVNTLLKYDESNPNKF